MRDIVRVDGSAGTIAALLRRGVRSPRIVACPLRMSDRSTPYCRHPTASMSCMHLMPAIHRVWPRSRGEARAFLRRGRALGASGHVATPEPFPYEWRAWCLRARGNTGALS
jgi:hypothetical protein